MRKQQQIWLKEHASQQTLPSLAGTEPSSSVIDFVNYLLESHLSLSGVAVDIGCGRGRNAVYLAEQGLKVTAVDYIEGALEAARSLAASKGQSGVIRFLQAPLDSPWEFASDNVFDIAVDCFSSIDIETRAGREICRDEMFRTLKPGGYALVAVVSTEDEWERAAAAEHPGPEPNSVIWPENGKFQKNYTEEELQDFYNKFTIVTLRKVQKSAHKLGRDGMATNFWLVLQKQQEAI